MAFIQPADEDAYRKLSLKGFCLKILNSKKDATSQKNNPIFEVSNFYSDEKEFTHQFCFLSSIFSNPFVRIQVCLAQAPLIKAWDKRFGGTDHDRISSFQQTSDGGFILGDNLILA